MRFNKTALLALFMLLLASVTFAQDKTTGGLKGKVRVEVGSASGVQVIVRQGEKEVTRATTQSGGDFQVNRLTPGLYGLTFRKPGLSVGTIENIEVKPGKVRSLGDRLILTIDEGSIAFIRGSVFTTDGHSVPNAKVELAKIQEDGNTKKIDSRVTTETGSFAFRLSPEVGKYRITLKVDSDEPISKDVDIDGAAVYRVALSLPPKTKP
jgi:hypothetical protein